MPWERDENGSIIEKDGNPVFIYPDGRKAPFNGESTIQAITKANGEAAERRKALKDLTEMVQPLKDAGVEFTPENISEFVAKAIKHCDIVSNYNDKDFVAAGDVEKLKTQAVENVKQTYERKIADQIKLFDSKVASYEEKFKKLDSTNRKLLIESEFKTNPFIKEQTPNIPWEFFYNTYGSDFNIEHDDQGNPIARAKRKDGSDVISLSKPGQFADPAEAIEILILEHPQKDSFVKGFSSGGTNTDPNATNYSNNNFTRTIKAGDQKAISQNIDKIAAGQVIVR